MDALDFFWHSLSEWLNMMVGWGNYVNHPSFPEAVRILERGNCHVTNPTGYAQIVRRAIREVWVEERNIPSGQFSLFMTAAGHFKELGNRHKFVDEDSLWIGTVSSDDPYFRALRKMMIDRVPLTPEVRSSFQQPPQPALESSLSDKAATDTNPLSVGISGLSSLLGSQDFQDRLQDIWAPILTYIRCYYLYDKIDVTGDDPLFFNVIRTEFGLSRSEAKGMTPRQVACFFEFAHRCRTAASDEARRHVLSEIASLIQGLSDLKDKNASTQSLLKALRFKFPDSKPPNLPASSDHKHQSSNGRLSKSGTEARPTGPPESLAEPKGPAAELPSKPRLSPDALVLVAAAELKKAGRKVSLSAACERAGVDRSNIRRRYPQTVQAIRKLATPDRTPRLATRDRRTGNLDAIDEADE